jgi:hypothetical protein
MHVRLHHQQTNNTKIILKETVKRKQETYLFTNDYADGESKP